MIKQTNDTLLCHLIASDQMLKGITPKNKTDEILNSPKLIKVGANQVIYIHHIQMTPTTNFNLKVTTPTRVLNVDENTTVSGSFNTIICGVGTIEFEASAGLAYTVQFVKVEY